MPPLLQDFVALRMPTVPLDEVEFRIVERLPFPLPGKSAMVIGTTVYLKEKPGRTTINPTDPVTVELVLHELVHQEQIIKYTWAGFLIRYFLGGVVVMERDAEERAAILTRAYFLDLRRQK